MGSTLATLAAGALPARDTENETSVAAAASQAKALVEARYLVALHRPRNIDQVRVKLLDACKRPGFAATAKYAKPIGKGKVVGPSIRFAEEAGRCLGNISVESPTLYDDEEKRVVRVIVTDLESNLSYSQDITLSKTVERSSVKPGQAILAQRVNSRGEIAFTVATTEDDLLIKQQALGSKHIRGGILRILPGDILEEAMAQVDATLRDEDAKDPAAARKKLIDAFYGVGVSPDMLVGYLGHPLEQVTPGELQELRMVFATIRDSEATWAAVIDAKGGEANGKSGTASLKDRVAAKAGAPVAVDEGTAQEDAP